MEATGFVIREVSRKIPPILRETSWKDFSHEYTLRLPNRDKVAEALAQKKIPHAIYYPVPLHLQQAYAAVGKPHGAFPQTDRAAAEVLSLPMHTELTEEQQRFIAHAVLEAVGS